ncbi:hypothetical protein M9458_020393 [Cirrhinus mrigala]|uniref:Uncharacterized protein n=1 Tax=Cirrhinus mrigala TaxID=683832 RepID=A0ABD0QEV3_CIRMR
MFFSFFSIINVMRELQNSLPSNNTAQPIISMIIKVTENLLSSTKGNLTKDWIINQQLTIALARILQGNDTSVDLAAAGVNLDHLLQVMAPLLSPEDRAFLTIAQQVSQTLTYALQVSSTDGGLQSENFTEAIISTVKMVLKSVSNETGALPQDVVNNILVAISGSLQLVLNPNISYAQANNLTQETIQMIEGAIHTLLPAEAAEVLVPIKNSILSYLNNISQLAGFDKWNELKQHSSAHHINDNQTAGVNLDHLLQAMAPLLSREDRAFLAVAEQVSQTLTYALQVSSTDGGFQSENFTEAVITTVKMFLESISNETGALPKDVVNHILDAFSSSLQLFLNPNMSYAQANNLTQETIQMIEGAIHTLLPAEAAEVLVPIKNSILSYLSNISQPAGFDKWNEL